MWKDILVFADGAEDGVQRLRLALDLAGKQAAHLEARIVSALPQHPYGPGAGAVSAAYQNLRHEAEARGRGARTALEQIAPPSAMLSYSHCDATFDRIKNACTVAARCADLTVVGQPENGDGSEIDTEILKGALFGGGPVLMAPRWIRPHDWGRRILIAWKGTAQAARAVQAALPLMPGSEEVRLLVVNPRTDGDGEGALARLADRLRRHGAKVEAPVSMTCEFDDQIGRTIEEEASAFGADLVVMGAYSHARFAEIVFGGVSKHMIRNARVPVLFSH